ncbi:MAG: helix-turn-helix domain-containing protein [Oscillospiraceae bacterium]|nr:helix-turn-helix domain-containing protein [Lachnospiraceae bacterium]MBO7727969.1 helix-turn-helix domain-containing protein [Oscillospiraceae bacterium]
MPAAKPATRKTFGQRVKHLRAKNNMTQEELAKRVGYTSKSTIAKIEADKVGAVSDKLSELAEALGTTADYLLGGDEEPKEIKEVQRIMKRIDNDKRNQILTFARYIEVLAQNSDISLVPQKGRRMSDDQSGNIRKSLD